MGLNITFWNCHGIRSKRKELELYLNENTIDIIALNETFLNKKVNFKIQGYDAIRNDRSTGLRGGVAFLVKHGQVVNKEFRTADFNIITDNEALAINLELSCNQNLTLATIYCPNGKPNFSLFQTISNLSDNVMFVGDFNSQLEAFGCVSKNDSGPILKTIQNKLNLLYLNNAEQTYMDWRNGNTDILDMAFITQNLAIHDLQFQIEVHLGSHHLPIEISIDTTPHRNTFTNHSRYKFDQTDREVFESILEEALGSEDFSGHLSTSDLDRYADFIITALHTAVDKAIPKSKSVRPDSNPISNETLALIKEKSKLRRQYFQMKDPAVKTSINQLQKQVKDDLRVESQASWKKFCNSISLETDSNESWCLGVKSEAFLSRRVSAIILLCSTLTKLPRPTPTKHNSLLNLSKGTLASRATILIRTTSTRSTNSSRITISIFILLRTRMTTGLTWEMSTSLWLMLMPKHSLS